MPGLLELQVVFAAIVAVLAVGALFLGPILLWYRSTDHYHRRRVRRRRAASPRRPRPPLPERPLDDSDF